MKHSLIAFGTLVALLAPAYLLAADPAYVGSWAFEDSQNYLGLLLNGDGTCRFVNVAKHDDALGANCKYEHSQGVISVTEYWDNSGVHEDASMFKLVFTYNATRGDLTLNALSSVVLVRVPELVTEKNMPREWFP